MKKLSERIMHRVITRYGLFARSPQVEGAILCELDEFQAEIEARLAKLEEDSKGPKK